MRLKSYDLSRRLSVAALWRPKARLFRASKIANFHARINLRPALRIAKWQQELALVVGEGAAIDCGCALCLIRVRRAVLGPRLFRGVHNGNSPGTVADFDATQFFARFYIDNGDVV
jgi:hypothetical protein